MSALGLFTYTIRLIGLQNGQKTVVTFVSLHSICSFYHNPVRNIPQYILGKVPCQEHINIYWAGSLVRSSHSPRCISRRPGIFQPISQYPMPPLHTLFHNILLHITIHCPVFSPAGPAERQSNTTKKNDVGNLEIWFTKHNKKPPPQHRTLNKYVFMQLCL